MKLEILVNQRADEGEILHGKQRDHKKMGDYSKGGQSAKITRKSCV
ncbi:MAG: hypothetical protein IPM04_00125 [Saprospiraceae bacterium]|nr:hypothetical protein [Candidatus Brachybacter algidus]MBK8746290.1 hypothetical protein [Candidatus Brachybacter algidus]